MRRVTVLLISLLFISIGLLSGCFEEDKQQDETDGYIQQLINNASVGDTINIPSGIYYEDVTVDKSIKLIGENRETTIIDGSVEVKADGVNISEFTIQNSQGSGINISSNYNTIWNNNILNNHNGIMLINSNNNVISYNNISNNIEWEGIVLAYSNNNVISYNIISDNARDGMWLQYLSNNNTLYKNIVSNNGRHGIDLYSSSNDLVSDNNVSNNDNNGIIIRVSSNNNTIKDNNLRNNRYGIEIKYYSDTFSVKNTIYNNNFIGNDQNAYDDCINTWDNGSAGNYWDDYTGIGDVPYNISGGDNQDLYPLMNQADI